MNKQHAHSRLNAFTVFEVTVVVAIVGILVAIISTAMNRFNEQLKVTATIAEETNQLRLVRSTIWRDFYFADSIQFSSNTLSIYHAGTPIDYSIIDDRLHRRRGTTWNDLQVNALAIESHLDLDQTAYEIVLEGKGEPIVVHYDYNPGVDIAINQFFNSIE